MYAIAKGSLVCHLTDIETGYTLCGQKVSRLPVDTEDKFGALYVVSEPPRETKFCDACLPADTSKPT
jgi:hypothetical protein